MASQDENIWLKFALNNPYHVEEKNTPYVPVDQAELAVGAILHNLSDRGFDNLLSAIDVDTHREIMEDCSNIVRMVMGDVGEGILNRLKTESE